MTDMNDHAYDDLAMEKAVYAEFGVELEVDAVIGRRFSISRNTEATLFLTKKKQLFLYIPNTSKLVLADVRKIVSHIGLKAELFLPPKGQPQYFDEIGTQKFREVFPGRSNITAQDIAFYRTLAPYSPALVLVQEVKDGTIYQFDSDSMGGWRQLKKFAYRRIKTS